MLKMDQLNNLLLDNGTSILIKNKKMWYDHMLKIILFDYDILDNLRL